MIQQTILGIGLLLVVLGIVEAPKRACDEAPAAPPPQQQPAPCSKAEARQFDFWVGDWDATWKMRVALDKDEWREGASSNSIRAEMGGCVIVEHFNGSPAVPLVGMSVSVYDANSNQWKQTWVDNQGGYLDFVGGFEDGKMILWREATVKGQKRLQRMVFSEITKDSFDWDWQMSRDDGKTWTTLWHIDYTRRKG